jgi:predicted nuclease of restriction endonuclease-like (RecB) superfamily
MKKKRPTALFKAVQTLIQEAQQHIVRNVNTTMLLTYFEIGRMIINDEQQGSKRAGYAKEILPTLSAYLSAKFGRGYSVDNLEACRKFYLTYSHRISESIIRKLKNAPAKPISESIIRKLKTSEKPLAFFNLSWTHYFQLLKIKDESERDFYEIEAVKNSWTVDELKRQFNSSLYERIALSKDKKGVQQLSKKGNVIQKATDALKSHYVLEFLDLREDERYSENDLETAIINRLEHFMLELGNGFLFEARQKRFVFEGDTFYVDLVFYNRYLKCFVLFDLKIGKLTHQDIGQMQMYVNYYDRKIKLPRENKTIGIILCKEENKTVIEFTLPEKSSQVFAKEYKAVLPTKAALAKQLQ